MAEKDLIKDLNEVVSTYNGLVAKWNSSGFRGKIPKELLSAINLLYTKSEQFISKYKGDFSA